MQSHGFPYQNKVLCVVTGIDLFELLIFTNKLALDVIRVNSLNDFVSMFYEV